MTSAYSVTLTLTDRCELERQLGFAVAEAIQEAHVFPRRGILVTRSDHHTIKVELTADVPFGSTQERDLRP
jgi:hypothetical protein